MKKFYELREKYKTFIYKSYSYEITPDEITVKYTFEIPGLETFQPTWKFTRFTDKDIESELIDRLIFSLGMVESISYWKCACPKQMIVECGCLTYEQKEWWRKLYYYGLGEFLYVNGVDDIDRGELIDIGVKLQVEDCCNTEIYHDEAQYDGVLIPIGGGKDSVVTLGLLDDMNVTTYCINANNTVKNVIGVFGDRHSCNVRRTLDAAMLKLNKEGFLNGHTPFSSIVAFSSYITAYINGKRYIALSNENSANESTIKDSFVNHQYSKSYQFERDFMEYIHTLTDSDITYFSMLRPLSELQISRLFADNTEYHKVFRSCNAGSKQGIWCCSCAKCMFVYIILSPFITQEKLMDIFGEKLFDKPGLEHLFRQLAGIEEDKPFECVGTRQEVIMALTSYINSGGHGLLVDKHRDTILKIYDEQDMDYQTFIHGWAVENNVPGELAVRLRARLEAWD